MATGEINVADLEIGDFVPDSHVPWVVTSYSTPGVTSRFTVVGLPGGAAAGTVKMNTKSSGPEIGVIVMV